MENNEYYEIHLYVGYDIRNIKINKNIKFRF